LRTLPRPAPLIPLFVFVVRQCRRPCGRPTLGGSRIYAFRFLLARTPPPPQVFTFVGHRHCTAQSVPPFCFSLSRSLRSMSILRGFVRVFPSGLFTWISKVCYFFSRPRISNVFPSFLRRTFCPVLASGNSCSSPFLFTFPPPGCTGPVPVFNPNELFFVQQPLGLALPP